MGWTRPRAVSIFQTRADESARLITTSPRANKQEDFVNRCKIITFWFSVTGCVCTIVLYEITKPWLKD